MASLLKVEGWVFFYGGLLAEICSIEFLGNLPYDGSMGNAAAKKFENVEDLIKLLRLEPLPREGGYIRQTWSTPYGTAIYYLITPGSWSAFHRLSHEEIWHFYAGDSAVQFQLFPDGRHAVLELGCHPEWGQMPQVLAPAGAWQSTRLKKGGRWALFGTTMAPPFRDEDYEHGEIQYLMEEYPDVREQIRSFACHE